MGVCTGLRWRPGATLWVTSLLVLLSFSSLVAEIRAQDSCGATNDATLSTVAARVPFSTCQDAWTQNSFNLRFQDNDQAETLNVILSTPKADRWYAIGFNKDASVMPGTHAITFWVDGSGTPRQTTHFLSSTGFQGVGPDTNNPLTFVTEPKLTSSSNTNYLSFVVKKPRGDTRFNNVVLAISLLADAPSGSDFNNQAQHQATQNVVVDYSTGVATATAAPSDSKLKAHGILNIIGWGVLLPLGMIIARYGKSFDPAWFYMHAVFQGIGYIFVVAGFGLGLNIYDRYKGAEDLDTHRTLGIVLFVLATLQVSAGIIRPKKDAKIRRFWNWGHFWLGRSALVIGIANIFMGIHVAKSRKSWKIAYGVILAIEIALLVPLEVLYWVKLRKDNKAVDQYPADHHTNGRRSDIESSAPPPVFDGENSWNNVKY